MTPPPLLTMRFDEGSTYEQWSNDMATDVDVVTLPIEEHSAMQEEIERLREALKPFATIDLLECRLPPEFAMHVLRARGALTPNPSLSGPLRWRDVAEELPQEAQEVLFVRGGKTLHGAWIGGIFWHSNQKMAAAYWMPLPLPPNTIVTGPCAGERRQMNTEAMPAQGPVDVSVGQADEAANTEGPRGTHGCACLDSDAMQCAAICYGMDHYGEPCECLCHQWGDDDECY